MRETETAVLVSFPLSVYSVNFAGFHFEIQDRRFGEMNSNTAAPSARASGSRRIFAIVMPVLLAGGAVAFFFYVRSYVTPGRFDAVRMNGIVEAVRRQEVGEEEVGFRVEDFSRPEAMNAVKEPAQAAPNVWAWKLKGVLQVAVMTKNSGHLGEYGFVFSEGPVTAWEDYPVYYHVPGPMKMLDEKIDDRWWKAANRDR